MTNTPNRQTITDAARPLGLVATMLDAMGDDASIERHIEQARHAQQYADDLLRAAVEQARAEGCTWAQIATWLGTSRQAAQQRFGG